MRQAPWSPLTPSSFEHQLGTAGTCPRCVDSFLNHRWDSFPVSLCYRDLGIQSPQVTRTCGGHSSNPQWDDCDQVWVCSEGSVSHESRKPYSRGPQLCGTPASLSAHP